MSHSQYRHKYMMFDTAIDSHSAIPLTLDEALDDLSQDYESYSSMGYMLRLSSSEKSLSYPAAPPSTRKSSFEIFDHNSHDKARGESFSSNDSAPSMFEDHSGLSDSDADPCADHDSYEESMGRLWDTYETLLVRNEPSEATIFHGLWPLDSSDDFQSPLLPCSSKIMLSHEAFRAPSRNRLGNSGENLVARDQHSGRVAHRRHIDEKKEQFIVTQNSALEPQLSGLRRSHAQRVPRYASNTSKPLPATPEKREGCTLQSARSKRSKSYPALSPFPPTQDSTYRDLPYRARPATNLCNSSHAYSIHNTPALPLIENSVFEYDTDDENCHDPVTQFSTTIVSRIHIRGLSLGSKLGLNPRRTADKHEEIGRRRSATEIVMSVFGLGRK